MATTSSMTGVGGGNRPDHIASGLEEDRLKPKPTVRHTVDVAAATLLANLPKLPEHQAEDTTPEMEATSNRLNKLIELLATHFQIA